MPYFRRISFPGAVARIIVLEAPRHSLLDRDNHFVPGVNERNGENYNDSNNDPADEHDIAKKRKVRANRENCDYNDTESEPRPCNTGQAEEINRPKRKPDNHEEQP